MDSDKKTAATVHLAGARKATESGDLSGLLKAFKALDDADCLSEIDERTDCMTPE